MRLEYRWIKDDAGALDRGFVTPLARHFGIDAFIETGTYLGDTIAAMRPAFAQLLSIELAPELAAAAERRFAGDDAISIIRADSPTGLTEAFARLRGRPAVIWLDAHYSGGPTAKGERNTPILAEIDQILASRGGRDVILVDDIRLSWPTPSGFLPHDTLQDYPLLSDVTQRLADSPHAYSVHVLGDVLVATPSGIATSPVLGACTASRLALPGTPPDRAIEAALVGATGSERQAIADVAPLMEAQKAYGLGGHCFYWRGLLREAEGALQAAREDFLFAARCGVIPIERAAAEPSRRPPHPG